MWRHGASSSEWLGGASRGAGGGPGLLASAGPRTHRARLGPRDWNSGQSDPGLLIRYLGAALGDILAVGTEVGLLALRSESDDGVAESLSASGPCAPRMTSIVTRNRSIQGGEGVHVGETGAVVAGSGYSHRRTVIL